MVGALSEYSTPIGSERYGEATQPGWTTAVRGSEIAADPDFKIRQ
jgi:hypothetical protein